MHGSVRLLVPVALVLLAGPGCSRKFFRERTDADVAGVITQKNVFPAWEVQNWHVYPDPRARFADPFNPDRPPYPVDDYAARVLSPNPQHPTKKNGTGRYDGDGYIHLLAAWDAENRAASGVGAIQSASASGEGVEGDKLVPAIALVPAETNAQPPSELPIIPVPEEPIGPGNAPQAKTPDAKGPMPPGEFPGGEELAVLGGNEEYARALRTNQEGFRITLEQAVQLALINSREFQDRREDLYLAALPVTLERYNFAAQAFFTEQVVRDFIGSDLDGGARLWRADTTAGFGKNFATGASLLVRMANQVVIDLGSDRLDVAFSNLSLSFIQPFLRGGGLAVNLEALTSAERNMLYAMRSYARFRKIFYVGIVAGGNITNNPYGLQGLSPNLGRGIGGNLTAPSVGFLALLQQAAQIANQEQNVAELERLFRIYKASQDGGQVSPLQVGQVEVQLLTSRGALLSGGGNNPGIRQYLDALDNFKLQLGLPITVALDPQSAPLKPIREQLARFEKLFANLRDLEKAARSYGHDGPIDQFRDRWRKLLTESELVKGTAFVKGISARWDAWAKLTPEEAAAKAKGLAEERRKLLDERTNRQVKNLPEPPAATERIAEIEAELDLEALERAIRLYETKPWTKPPIVGIPSTESAAFSVVFEAFYIVALGARNERVIQTRDKWPELPGLPVNGVDLLETDLDTAYTTGIQTALSQRLDLMNARGQVVDAYRNIAVQANSLQGVFDVGYDYRINTPVNESKPFAFSSDRARHTLTFRGELPLVRRAERNNYRASLVSYQRQRRTLMAFEDNIANDVRVDIRELRTLAQLYKIQQRVVELGYEQVDNSQAVLFAPPGPDARADAGSATALTEQVLRSQRDLLAAQNALYGLWVSYTTARMNLYLDLELMQLDERGVWCDEPTSRPDDVPRSGPEQQPIERLPAPRGVEPADRK